MRQDHFIPSSAFASDVTNGPQILSMNVCLPEEMIRDCRATTLERIVVDRVRAQLRPQIKEAKRRCR